MITQYVGLHHLFVGFLFTLSFEQPHGALTGMYRLPMPVLYTL